VGQDHNRACEVAGTNGDPLASGGSGQPHPAGCGAPPTGSRVALVSGGNRGLGLEIVRTLAERGLRVVLGSRSPERGRAAIELLGDRADFVAVRQLDITNATSVDVLAAWLRRRLGRCDVLVNNAAVLMNGDQDATVVDLEVVRSTLDTNLLGAWRLIQAVVPLMRRCRYGRIVNVSSGTGSIASMGRGVAAYRVSKAAVNALTRTLARELVHDGILVNACSPDPLRVEDRGPSGPPRLAASADTPVWLATLPDDGPTGGFYRERVKLDW
jgi:NAD(P)-dependent dehydrogenase (short-subunit alcohol dehydrogenase family)